MVTDRDLFDKISLYLVSTAMPYTSMMHDPVFTSSEAASVSGHLPGEGTKSLVLLAGRRPIVVTVPGDERVDVAFFKERLNEKRLSVAPTNILKDILGVELGGVAPFGYDDNIEVFVKSSFLQSRTVYFNPGVNDITFCMKSFDFIEAANAMGAKTFD